MLSSILNPSIGAGELVHRITIQAQATTPDPSTGQPAVAWSPVLSTRARILTSGARELYQAQQYAPQLTHMVTIRWPGAVVITSGMQVVFGSRTFTIQTIENVQERNRVLHLMCIEINGVTS